MNTTPIEIPCSHGSYGFVNGITEQLNHLPCEGVLINVQTLLRNLYSDNAELSSTEILTKIKAEMQAIITLLAPLLAKKNEAHPPYLMFYLFDYTNILNHALLRGLSDNQERQKIAEFTATLIGPGKIPFKNRHLGESDGVHIYGYGDNTKQGWPHTRLFRWINEISPSSHVFMVSHQPVDWHLKIYLRQLYVIASFTGAVHTANEFGRKVFGDAYAELPFCPSTHKLMGDKTLIAPFLTPKKKKELLDRSIQEQWGHHSQKYIEERIKTQYGVSV